MLWCKPADTTRDPNVKFSATSDSLLIDKGRYQRLVGRLIYLVHTCPDISFSVSVVSQFMGNPNEDHLNAAYRILQYLKKTLGNVLLFKKNECRKVDVYIDSDWAGSSGRRSTTGYCTFVWGILVTWRSKKQPVVEPSSADADH